MRQQETLGRPPQAPTRPGIRPSTEDPLRSSARFLVPCVFALAGCGGSSSVSPDPSALLDGAVSPAAETLEEANREYLEGVRAFVQESYRDAETHFHRVLEKLAFAGSEEAATLDARDAETLLAKSEYFLDKIAEMTLDEAPVLTEAPDTAAPTTWEVAHGSITPKQNRDVDRWIDYFCGDGRKVFQKWLDRKPAYDPVFEEALARHQLPPELAYASMIESGFSPHAYSWAHAVGLWQFVRSTGRRYGLRADWWVDERRDPVRSTDAAAMYLKDLYTEFQDWELAIAAYNVGEGRVRKQIARQGTRDFWRLSLPRETRNHIPKFYAAMILGMDPEKYGFSKGEGSPPATEVVNVDGCVDFDVLAECAGTEAQTLAELNPALVRRCTPPDTESWQVRVPTGTAEKAMLALAELPPSARVRWAHHVVRRGETLSKIAAGYRTSVDTIVEVNRLKSRHRLSVGQELLIPQGQKSGAPLPKLAMGDTDRPSSSSSSRATTIHTVRRGDTLSTIAQRYGTSTGQIRRLNKVGRHIYPGQRLTVPDRRSSRSASAPSPTGTESRGTFVKVAPGDTLWNISQRTGVSVTELLRANNLRRSSLLKAGQVIRIP